MSDDIDYENGLTLVESADVRERVKRIVALLKRSAAVWLEIAKEFCDAKVHLSQEGFEQFGLDAGFTKAVADKLVGIGKCERLYRSDSQEFTCFVDGWSTLYEVSKLADSEIDILWQTIRSKPSIKLSRTVVQNVAKGAPAEDKTILFATIEAQKSKFDALSPDQVAFFASKLNEIHSLFYNIPHAFTLSQRHDGLKLLRSAPQANNAPQLLFN